MEAVARRRLQHLNPAGVRDKLAMSRHGADAVSGLYLARVKVNKVRSRAPAKGPGLPQRLHYSNISGNDGGEAARCKATVQTVHQGVTTARELHYSSANQTLA